MQLADIKNTNIPNSKPRRNNNQRGNNQQSNKQQTKQAVQNPLTLRGWVYAADGKHIKELIQTSFLEFYFMRKAEKTAVNNGNNELRQNA